MQMFKFAILQVGPERILPKAGQLSPCQLTLRASQGNQQLDRFFVSDRDDLFRVCNATNGCTKRQRTLPVMQTRLRNVRQLNCNSKNQVRTSFAQGFSNRFATRCNYDIFNGTRART